MRSSLVHRSRLLVIQVLPLLALSGCSADPAPTAMPSEDLVDAVKIHGPGSLQLTPPPVFVVDGRMLSPEESRTFELDLDRVEKIRVLKGGFAKEAYGPDAPEAIVEVTLSGGEGADSATAGSFDPAAPAPTLAYTRIRADAAGESHFSGEEMELELADPGRGIPPTPASAPMPATGLRFFCPPAGGDADWHPVPARVFNLVVSGELEIEVSDGEVRRFGPGSLVLGEDTTGRGHRTRVVGTGACFAMVLLPPP